MKEDDDIDETPRAAPPISSALKDEVKLVHLISCQSDSDGNLSLTATGLLCAA